MANKNIPSGSFSTSPMHNASVIFQKPLSMSSSNVPASEAAHGTGPPGGDTDTRSCGSGDCLPHLTAVRRWHQNTAQWMGLTPRANTGSAGRCFSARELPAW